MEGGMALLSERTQVSGNHLTVSELFYIRRTSVVTSHMLECCHIELKTSTRG